MAQDLVTAAIAWRAGVARDRAFLGTSALLFVASAGEKKHRLLVTPGIRTADLAAADCTIECSLSDIAEARERGLSPFQLFSAGKLRIRGNVQIAMALAAVFTR